MAISYNKLWKLLIDRNMGKCHLRAAVPLAPNTLTKMRKEELVSTSVLCRICDTLGVGLDEIVEYTPEPKKE